MDHLLPTSPAADRNKLPILAQLQRLLTAEAMVLEVASGTGQHAQHFAAAMPQWRWQPSDAQATLFDAIVQRCASLPNVAKPRLLDVLDWPADLVSPVDAVYCANMLHIAPWACTAGLMRGAASVLKSGGHVLIYGPFIEDGLPTAPSNLEFDASLRAQDPAWGLRRLADVQREAERFGLRLSERVSLPANNLLLHFSR